MRGAELRVGHETSLGTGERVCMRAGRMNCHSEQTHRNTLACGHQHVHLARRRVGIDAERLIDQVVGGVSHGGDHDGHVIAGVLRFDDASGHALLFRLNNALGHTFDRFGIGDRRTAVLLHDESHNLSNLLQRITCLIRQVKPIIGNIHFVKSNRAQHAEHVAGQRLSMSWARDRRLAEAMPAELIRRDGRRAHGPG